MDSDFDFSADAVFGMLFQSSAYEPRSGPIQEKGRIFGHFWANDGRRLQDNFDDSGCDPHTGELGFGTLVECFAGYSAKIPQNTPKGQEMARAILSALHHGNSSLIRLGRARSQGDFLEVVYTGRQAVIKSTTEVKSSSGAALEKASGQLIRQEGSLKFLADRLREKERGDIGEFFRKRKVIIAEDLKKNIVVPYGEGDRLRMDPHFTTWNVIELEFGYNEFLFIAQQLWPKFRPDIKFGIGRLAVIDTLSRELSKLIGPVLSGVFSDSIEYGKEKPLPFFELSLFILATEKMPIMETDVAWAVDTVQAVYWPAIQDLLDSLPSSGFYPDSELDKKDRQIISRLGGVLTSSKEDLKLFIRFIRMISIQIGKAVVNQRKAKLVKSFSDYPVEQI